MSTEYQDSHLRDEELIGLLDGQGAPADQLVWSEHLEACAGCSERFDELEEAAGWLEDHVKALDAGTAVDELARARALTVIRAASRRRLHATTSGRLLRAAAMIAIVVLAGVSVRPLSGWVSDRIGRLSGSVEETPVIEPPEAPVGSVSAAVAFRPTDSVFRIELARRQTAGDVTIELARVEQATARVLEGHEETFTVLPSGLWVENAPGSAARYRIQLPIEYIRRVQVVAGGVVLAERPIDETTDSIVVNLAATTGP